MDRGQCFQNSDLSGLVKYKPGFDVLDVLWGQNGMIDMSNVRLLWKDWITMEEGIKTCTYILYLFVTLVMLISSSCLAIGFTVPRYLKLNFVVIFLRKH